MSVTERELRTVASDDGLVGGPFGSNLVSKDYTDSGIPVIRGTNMLEPYIGGDFTFVSTEKYSQDLIRNDAQPNDLVFTQRGTLGQVSMVPLSPFDRYVISQSQMRLRIDQKKADPHFVYYACRRPQFLCQVDNNAIATGVPHINLGILARLTIPDFSLAEQRAIAEVLGALDDKIAANDQAQRLASELARTTFESAAKAGIRHIIRDAIEIVTRGIAPKYTEDGGITVLNQKCVRDQWVSLEPARVTSSSSTRGSKVLRLHDVLVNSTGFGTLGRAARWIRDMDATVDSHISIVRFDANLVDPVCAGFGLLRLEKQIESLAEGSTGQTELRRDLLAGLEILVPRSEDQKAVGSELSALDDHALALEDESQKLATTRDSLLPLLMSGKVRVRDAEKIVEEAV